MVDVCIKWLWIVFVVWLHIYYGNAKPSNGAPGIPECPDYMINNYTVLNRCVDVTDIEWNVVEEEEDKIPKCHCPDGGECYAEDLTKGVKRGADGKVLADDHGISLSREQFQFKCISASIVKEIDKDTKTYSDGLDLNSEDD